MKQITTGTVQTAQIEVSNLHDDTREFDITATVYFSSKADAFGGNANGQISNGAVNIDDETKTTLFNALRYMSLTAQPVNNPHTAVSPYGGTAKYSLYNTTDISLAFLFHETDYYSEFLTNYRQGYIIISAQLQCDDSYKATLNIEELSQSDIYNLGTNSFAVAPQTILSEATCGSITPGQDEDIQLSLSLSLPYLYLDHSDTAETSKWHLYIYVEYKYTPNSRRLLASMDIDYDKRGQQTVDKYAEYENSQTGGGGSS